MSESMTEDELLEKLMKPFPEKSFQENNFSGFKSIGVKTEYIVDRLNEVLGIRGWDHFIDKGPDGNLLIEISKDGKFAICYGTLTWNQTNKDGTSTVIKSISSYGSMRINGSPGDAYKGAKTDSLGKCASYLGVAHQAYKGDLKMPPKGSEAPPPAQAPVDKAKQEFIKYTKIKKFTDEAMQQEAQDCFGKMEVNSKKFKAADWKKYLKHLKEKYGEVTDS